MEWIRDVTSEENHTHSPNKQIDKYINKVLKSG